MIDEQGSADLTCRFCDNVQHFSRADLEAMVRGLQQKNVKKIKFPVDRPGVFEYNNLLPSEMSGNRGA